MMDIVKCKNIFIIAEAGVNHNGDIAVAKKLIDVAANAKADAVKFQTFQARHVVSRLAPKADYQTKTTDTLETQFEMIKKLELGFQAHKELIAYCRFKQIAFLSTPFDIPSIDLLHELGLPIIKIPSGEITNLPYLRHIGKLKKQLILSTGMADIGEIEDALDVLSAVGSNIQDVTVLHCNTEYPTPCEDVNLKAMLTIKAAFPGIKVGYSDHTQGIAIAIAAAAMGAEVIEKHFTLDKNMDGPDHQASLVPAELKTMVKAIRNIEIAMGNGVKKPGRSELKNKIIARKSIVAKQVISKGEVLSENNITVKRPGAGISPMRWDEIIGQKAVYDFKEDELIVL